MQLRKFHLILLAVLAGCTSTGTRLDVLKSEFQQRRSLSPGTSTDCPDNLDELAGFTLDQIEAALGPPDLRRPNEIAYYFGSPHVLRVGGGEPELSFFAETSGVVKDVLCLYSQ